MKTIYISNETLRDMIQETYLRIVKEGRAKASPSAGNINVLAEAEKRYIDVTATILRETEKAYQIAVKYYTEKGLSVKEAKMWCPKSCCIVENGNVTQVADFVLNRWQQEYFDFLKSKGYRSSPIFFDLKHLQNITNKKKTEKEEYKAFYDEVLNKLIEDLRPIANRNIKGIGMYCKMLGLYFLSKGFAPSNACDKLINLGDATINKFGSADSDEQNWLEDFFNSNPDNKGFWDVTLQYERLFAGFSVSQRLADYPKNLKYSTRDILDYEIGAFNGNYGKNAKMKSKLYKTFRKYADCHENVLNAICDTLR